MIDITVNRMYGVSIVFFIYATILFLFTNLGTEYALSGYHFLARLAVNILINIGVLSLLKRFMFDPMVRTVLESAGVR